MVAQPDGPAPVRHHERLERRPLRRRARARGDPSTSRRLDPRDGLSADAAPFTFVPDGVTAAIAQACELAGEGDVAVCAGDVGGQAVAAGLVDEVAMDIAPVLLGQGKRYFGDAVVPVGLPTTRPSSRATGLHLRYRVRH